MGLPGSMWCSCVLAAKARLVNASHCRCHRCRAAPEDRRTVEQPRDASRPRCRSRHAMSTHSRLKSSPNVRHLPPDRGCSDSAKRRRTQAISTLRPTSRRAWRLPDLQPSTLFSAYRGLGAPRPATSSAWRSQLRTLAAASVRRDHTAEPPAPFVKRRFAETTPFSRSPTPASRPRPA